MLEEFRRRKNLKSYRDKQDEILSKSRGEDEDPDKEANRVVGDQKVNMHPKEQEPGGAERFFDPNPIEGDTFDTQDFTLIVMSQGSTTNVTRLQRINQ